MEENKKKTIILTIIAVSCLLVVVFGATYAYFQVLATNNVSTTNTQGQTDTMPKGTLVTNTALLKLNLDANLMSKENENTTYYATESGTPVTVATEGSGKYTLATASLDKTGISYDCTYSYRISATKTKAINDGSDADVKVKITGSDGYTETYTLEQLLRGEKIYTGNIRGLTYGTNQKIYIEAYVENTTKPQDDLAGNSFTFKIELVDKSFKCDVPNSTAGETFAEKLIDSNELWQSGLEGDGYRYTGSGNYDSATTPDNFICFGTTDKTTCKGNESKYLYRIIGVFPDSSGNQHAKLISFKQLGAYAWNANYQTDVSWENSDMYAGLNGEYFLTNTTYDYMQNNTWLNKIEDWQWSAVNTKTYTDITNGVDYYETPPKAIYQHEMHKSVTGDCYNSESERSTCTVGEWSTPVEKIGLMYASDYTLSLGDTALAMTTGTYTNRTTLKTGWMHYSNNGITDDEVNYGEWTLSRRGAYYGNFTVWIVGSGGRVGSTDVNDTIGVRPVFHLTSDARTIDGDGSYSNPYILE